MLDTASVFVFLQRQVSGVFVSHAASLFVLSSLFVVWFLVSFLVSCLGSLSFCVAVRGAQG